MVADTAERAGWAEVVFFDLRFSGSSRRHQYWPLVGFPEDALTQECDGYFVAIGQSKARQQWSDWLIARGLPLVTLVDPSSVVSQYASLGGGVLVVAGAVVNAGACVKNGVIINTRAGVDHDCVLGAYSHICPGASLAGGVSVGAHSWIGIGSQVREGVCVGSNVLVGAGATVVCDIDNSLTVVGTPARARAR